MTEPSPKLWRHRAMIMAIVLSAFVPFALAWYYARHPELIRDRSNYGNLFIPPAPVNTATLWSGVLARSEALPDLRGRWVLLQLGADGCGDSACLEVLHKSHQTRLMLNKEIQRVRRVLLLPVNPAPERLSELLATDEDVVVAALPPDFRAALGGALGHSPAADTVLLMDPLGNLVLWYDAGFDPYKMLKDLKHLLKASQIG